MKRKLKIKSTVNDLDRSSNEKWELNVQANIKMKNGKKLEVKALVDSGYTHTRINEQ